MRCKLVHVEFRTHRIPNRLQALQRKILLQAVLDVARRKSRPHHIPKARRAVIEHVHLQPRVEGAGKKGKTGSQARPDDPDVLVTRLLEPVDTGPDVMHCLPGRMQGSPNIRRHCVVGPRQRWWHPPVVIGQAQPQRRNAQLLKTLTQRDMLLRTAIPVRQYDHRPLLPVLLAHRHREPAPLYQVVLRIRRTEWRTEAQPFAIKRKVGRRLVLKVLRPMLNRGRTHFPEPTLLIPAVIASQARQLQIG